MSISVSGPIHQSQGEDNAALFEFPKAAARPGESSRIPVMPATAVILELLLDQPVIDLQAVSEVVLSDIGATLQILRIDSDRWERGEQQWLGMPACVVALGKDAI